jgi:DNA-binding MarR family transcriptional regulator
MGTDTVDDVMADFQGHLNLIFARARSMWKETAARMHPELQPAGYKLLSFISRTGPTSAHQLAERFEMDKSMVSRQIRMLEEFDLIESRADERDGRLRVLTATPEASRMLAVLRGEHAERMRTVLAGLTADEVRAASKAFSLLAEV